MVERGWSSEDHEERVVRSVLAEVLASAGQRSRGLDAPDTGRIRDRERYRGRFPTAVCPPEVPSRSPASDPRTGTSPTSENANSETFVFLHRSGAHGISERSKVPSEVDPVLVVGVDRSILDTFAICPCHR